MSIKAEAKKLEIFSLHKWNRTSGHSASSVVSLLIRHFLRWSDLLLRLCALTAAPLSAIVNMLNKREESGEDYTWRGRQPGPTRSMAVRKQVPHRKILPPNAILTLGTTGLST